ncbi:dipeptidase [Amycolatopsis sp. CA-230715]|uniref:dipeptidase n=1 Tax=Amycolatopsis sp. CA-230715 TaxID=2745196 RepID=UPI001C00E0ED|nr:membrane dipeptidase [Amycolatopsis sp. CA-230715]QWF85379.1 hypothetical protein HUW46_08833 [Amycolatopsis sp. CA-230715]
MSTPPLLPVADCHNDLLLHVLYHRERGHPDPFGEFWLPQLRAGGVVCQVLPICTQQQFAGEAALRRCLLMVEEAHRFADRHADDVAIVHTGHELAEARAAGRIALLLALEGTEPIGNDLALLEVLFRAGIRMASLTWNRRTMMADGVGETDTGGRLTRLGVDAVAEMQRLGVIVDVSHLSDRGFWHVDEIATRPFVASHSGCRACHVHARNLTDDHIRAITAHGGVVGINAFGPFVSDTPSIAAYLDHVAHAVSVAGAGHVAFGTDFFHDIAATTDPITTALLAPGTPALNTPGLCRPGDFAGLGHHLVERLGRETARQVAATTLLEFLRRTLPAPATDDSKETELCTP